MTRRVDVTAEDLQVGMVISHTVYGNITVKELMDEGNEGPEIVRVIASNSHNPHLVFRFDPDRVLKVWNGF